MRELCECSWDPFPASSPAEVRAANHDRGTHVAGAGECLGRDSYGLRCGCRGFEPMGGRDDLDALHGDDDEDGPGPG